MHILKSIYSWSRVHLMCDAGIYTNLTQTITQNIEKNMSHCFGPSNRMNIKIRCVLRPTISKAKAPFLLRKSDNIYFYPCISLIYVINKRGGMRI